MRSADAEIIAILKAENERLKARIAVLEIMLKGSLEAIVRDETLERALGKEAK